MLDQAIHPPTARVGDSHIAMVVAFSPDKAVVLQAETRTIRSIV